MRSPCSRYLLLLLAGAPSGCTEELVFEDEGWVCLSIDSQGDAESLRIEVRESYPTVCGGYEPIELTCEAMRDGREIAVHAQSRVEKRHKSVCKSIHIPADPCVTFLDVPPDGDYTLRYADTELAFSLPSVNKSFGCTGSE